MPNGVKHDVDGTSDNAVATGEAESEAVCPDSAPVDPDLAKVIAAWWALPAGVRAGIVAAVDGATRQHV